MTGLGEAPQKSLAAAFEWSNRNRVACFTLLWDGSSIG